MTWLYKEYAGIVIQVSNSEFFSFVDFNFPKSESMAAVDGTLWITEKDTNSFVVFLPKETDDYYGYTYYDAFTQLDLALPYSTSDYFRPVFLALNATHLFTAFLNEAFLINAVSESITRLEDPTVLSINGSFAGLFENGNGEMELVVAGGRGSNGTTEIFSPKHGTWRSGPLMPVVLEHGASVQYGNTFLAVGGMDNNGTATKSVYMFDPEGWIEMPQKMENGRAFFAAFLVDEDYLPC